MIYDDYIGFMIVCRHDFCRDYVGIGDLLMVSHVVGICFDITVGDSKKISDDLWYINDF